MCLFTCVYTCVALEKRTYVLGHGFHVAVHRIMYKKLHITHSFMLALLLLTGCLGKWSLAQRLPQLKMITTYYLLVVCVFILVSTPFSFTHSCHPLCALFHSFEVRSFHADILNDGGRHIDDVM